MAIAPTPITERKRQLDEEDKNKRYPVGPSNYVENNVDETRALLDSYMPLPTTQVEEPVVEEPAAPTSSLEDYKALLEKSKQGQRNTGLMADLGQIGTEYLGRMAGYKPDTSIYEEMRKQAGADVTGAEAGIKRAEENAAKIEQAKELAKTRGLLTEYQKGKLGLDERKLEQTMTIEEKRLALRDKAINNSIKGTELRARELGHRVTDKLENRVRSISKMLDESQEAGYEVAKERVTSALDRATTEGRGRFASWLPNWVNSTEGQKFKGDVQALITPIRKGNYGSALTATELKNFEEMTQTGKGADYEAFNYALRELMRAKDAQLNNIRAIDQDAYETIMNRRRSGFYVKPQTGESAATTPASSGDWTLPKDHVPGSVLKRKDGTRWEVNQDGKTAKPI